MFSPKIHVGTDDAVPGTDIMRIDGHVASGGLIGGEIVLVPKPSNDPNDPLVRENYLDTPSYEKRSC